MEEFGRAMLRGMGWQEGMGVGRNRKKVGVGRTAHDQHPHLSTRVPADESGGTAWAWVRPKGVARGGEDR